jgi:hypothetical protein
LAKLIINFLDAGAVQDSDSDSEDEIVNPPLPLPFEGIINNGENENKKKFRGKNTRPYYFKLGNTYTYIYGMYNNIYAWNVFVYYVLM